MDERQYFFPDGENPEGQEFLVVGRIMNGLERKSGVIGQVVEVCLQRPKVLCWRDRMLGEVREIVSP
jgi:hypothetical protein